MTPFMHIFRCVHVEFPKARSIAQHPVLCRARGRPGCVEDALAYLRYFSLPSGRLHFGFSSVLQKDRTSGPQLWAQRATPGCSGTTAHTALLAPLCTGQLLG